MVSPWQVENHIQAIFLADDYSNSMVPGGFEVTCRVSGLHMLGLWIGLIAYCQQIPCLRLGPRLF